MRLDKFTLKGQEALQAAQSRAEALGSPMLEPEHLLEALIAQEDGIVAPLLKKLGVPIDSVRTELDQYLTSQPKVEGAQVSLSPNLDKVFQQAVKESEQFRDEYISSEHLLLAISASGTFAGKLLQKSGGNRSDILKVLVSVRGNQRVTDQNAEEKYQALKRYAKDLTDLARKGKIDPVIGRDDEIRRIIQVLSRRTKNNPVLIGEPGVGKTAIVEGLAQRIVAGDVPETLKRKQMVALDLGSMLAGAKYRGEFEDRLKAVLREIEDSAGSIVLFIDELHTLVGAGAAEGAIDASNMLKPALARGELRCIGATTLNEYKKHIEKDAALERRFQPVVVSEPTVEDTIAILRGLKEKYEIHHGVRIMDSALVSASVLSNRYIADRFLPDKAIDLVDEAASRLRIEIDSMPVEIDEVERRITQLEIEKQALSKEKDKASRERLDALNSELSDLQEKSSRMKLHWKQEREIISAIQTTKEKIEGVKAEEQNAERAGDLGKAAELRYGTLVELEKELSQQNNRLETLQSSQKFLKEEVDEEDIAEVVAKWTGIPVRKMLEGEVEKLIHMESRLRERVLGQDEALASVSNAIRRARAGLQDAKRPMGSFIFMGPTGVGKTELARTLAEFLFDDEHAMIRIDMSEYMEKHSVARLIGAPPGYVGYEEGGYLTETVRRRPYAVILFDEIEKAHPDVFNILLQILDDGRLTDGKGRTVNFKNTVIIMTSNIGGQAIGEAEGNLDAVTPHIMDALRSTFRPEFLNRIDDIIIFHQLTPDLIEDIVKLQLRQLNRMLSEKDLELEANVEAAKALAREGYDPVYGARPLKRLIQKRIQDRLALMLLSGDITPGEKIQMNLDKKTGEFVFVPFSSPGEQLANG
jgi:ATP-dependent Clp protease ATP-binding subunit ClpB